MPHLFDPLPIRAVTFPNRVFVSPMCEYSCVDGLANDWHFVHLGSRAVGGAGLVMTEATAVTAEGRISPQDLGLWTDGHVEPLARIVRFIHEHGSVAGIQLAHAGRKASTYRPWSGEGAVAVADGGWTDVVAPSAIPFAEPLPDADGVDGGRHPRHASPRFAAAARRARTAGFRVVEIHAAHGYLLHEFLSPLSNHRTDQYGGSFANRTRLLLDVVVAVRAQWPEGLPLFVRISATDWTDGGWDLPQSIELARLLKTCRRRPGRLLVGRQRAGAPDSARARLPDAVRRRDSPARRDPYRRRRADHHRGAGRTHRPHRSGGRGVHRPRTAPRPVLPAPGGARTRPGE